MPTDERSPRRVAPITFRTRAVNAIRDGVRRRIDRFAPGRSRPTVTATVVASCAMLAVVGATALNRLLIGTIFIVVPQNAFEAGLAARQPTLKLLVPM